MTCILAHGNEAPGPACDRACAQVRSPIEPCDGTVHGVRMRRIDALFARYGESHRNAINKAIHWLCVPLIMWSVLAALWAWTPLAAGIVVAAATAYYAWLSPR